MEISEALEFLATNHRSVVITYRADGSLAPSPVNHGVDDQGRVAISSREPAYKVLNLRRDPRVTLCAFTDQFYGPWVTVTGTAEIISLPEAMEPLVELYRGVQGEHPDWDDYRAAMIRDKRVIVAITPTSAGPDRHA
jgi:PPOX class probable F420-dependent enzyme